MQLLFLPASWDDGPTQPSLALEGGDSSFVDDMAKVVKRTRRNESRVFFRGCPASLVFLVVVRRTSLRDFVVAASDRQSLRETE